MKTSAKRTSASALLLFLLFCLALSGCGGDKGSGEDATQKARQELASGIIVFPDSEEIDAKYNSQADAYIITYRTNETIDVLEEFFPAEISRRGFSTVLKSGNAITYKNDRGKSVTVSWYPRDPDIFGYNSVFHIAVKPVPKALKPAPTEQPAE